MITTCRPKKDVVLDGVSFSEFDNLWCQWDELSDNPKRTIVNDYGDVILKTTRDEVKKHFILN